MKNVLSLSILLMVSFLINAQQTSTEQSKKVSKKVKKVKAEEKRSAELQVKENGFWDSYITEQYLNGEDLNYINRYSKELIDKLSVESVKKAANQFLGDNFAKFVLLPEKK